MDNYEIKQVTLDGVVTYKLTCPSCGVRGYIDNDQFCGEISIECKCGNFHETIDFRKSIVG